MRPKVDGLSNREQNIHPSTAMHKSQRGQSDTSPPSPRLPKDSGPPNSIAMEAANPRCVANPASVDYLFGVIHCVTSSLFDSPAQTLVNTVNTVGVMGKGIANDFRRLYPDMFERYREFCSAGRFEVGQLYLHRTPHKWVLNFPTKRHWRHPSKLEWIEDGLRKFAESYSRYGITSVAFPQLGTGNGGLDWNVVRPVMEHHLKSVRIPVYIHLRPRDPKFVPEHLTAGDVRALSRELHAPRVDVTFEQFVDDVRKVFHGQVKQSQGSDELPLLEMRISEGVPVVVTGEQLLDLWQGLKLRGAVDAADLPRTLKSIDLQFLERLMSLDYIKAIPFAEEGRPGLRYAPPSASHVPEAIDVIPE